ncbi:nmrA-like family protein [Aspergillus arachidicola]|uniref:NmrA-like family protein n=1 Tax=Aspergillus arachidicola TaxID=656916 RepID=A0A2G7FTW5_9EURO|nr:nmrA-like family protein [Aspergillus arachidicola]
MAFNRIAVYGHRGFVGSRVVPALIASGAPVTVLHRPSSDTSNLPDHVRKIAIDVHDEVALVDALQDIDIVISLVGDEGTDSQFGFVKAIPRTNVQLFSPSDFSLRYCEQGMRIPCMKAKAKVEKAAKDAGIPTTVVQVGNFAEFTLSTTAVGIDLQNNTLVHTGNSASEKVTMCTKDYVAAAYVDIFTTRPISTIQNRTIGLSELAPTGMEIAAIMKKKNARDPSIATRSLEKVEKTIENCISQESNFAIPLIAARSGEREK